MKVFNFVNAITPAPDNAINEIVFYDSIQDLPMFRLNEFQIHLSQDSGIGATLQDFDRRLQGIYESLAANDMPNAIKELQNAKIGWYLMLNSISTSARALADLVYSINGVPLSDFTNDALMRVHSQIKERLSMQQVDELINSLKKKFKRELEVSFPELFTDAEQNEFYLNIVRRAKLQLADWRNESESPNAEIAQIELWLREEMKPEIHDTNNVLNSVDAKRRSFESVCTGLLLYGILNAELLSVYKFHARILYIHQNKPTVKQHDTFHNEM